MKTDVLALLPLPSAAEPSTQNFALSFDELTFNRLTALAHRLGITVGEIIPNALDLFLIAVDTMHGPGKENLRLALIDIELNTIQGILQVEHINKVPTGLVAPNGRPL